VTLAMLNSEIPGIQSGRTPFYSRNSRSPTSNSTGSRTKVDAPCCSGRRETSSPMERCVGTGCPHGEGWMPVAETKGAGHGL
jgi:hypothetical protein